VKSCRLEAFTTELERAISEISGPSVMMKVVRYIMQKSFQKESSVFPTTLLYSFAEIELGLALSFFPASETKTQIRYDLFSRSAMSQDETRKLSGILQRATEGLAQEIKTEYETVSKKR
jgi:hypothetical protein